MNDSLHLITWATVLRGLSILAGGIAVAFLLAFGWRAIMRWRGRGETSRKLLSQLIFWVITAFAFAGAITLVFPSINPVDILGGVGVISIAAGIAFQTVLGNMFAGIVILSRDQYRVNDQVKVGDNSGEIIAIRLSSTVIRTFDGQKVIIPNTIMHSTQVVVQTGYERIRTRIGVELDANTDLERAVSVAEQAMKDLDLVMNEPSPRAMLSAIGTGTVTMDLMFWSGSRKLESREATDVIIRQVIAALKESDIQLATSSPTINVYT
ncbi:mechanosensitive ion channel family protein [Actinomyces vulturis]|uniref:mechanosensitive ion channel family protein n=1 Tax=Actinomyces vulturis TaxID=1857645 RepID=UPI0008341C07|nr:mechanosensitive ion channel domain-containing protein [Actinomyces vulturis]